jgi:catechol 2,3-dioxygenase-like lactoylglutathione lyase family enzyme
MRLAHAILYTSNLEDSVSFFRELLNIEPVRVVEGFVEFVIGNSAIGIKQSAEDRETPGHGAIALEADDLQGLYAAVRAKNSTLAEDLTTESWGTFFAVFDPDGNKIEFVAKQK